jgi:hypothetical protein
MMDLERHLFYSLSKKKHNSFQLKSPQSITEKCLRHLGAGRLREAETLKAMPLRRRTNWH